MAKLYSKFTGKSLKIELAFDDIKSSTVFCPMLSVLFLGAYLRAQQLVTDIPESMEVGMGCGKY